MKIKLYNKKKFGIGILFLLLASISILGTILNFNDLDMLNLIKNIILDAFCIIFGLIETYRGLSNKCSKEDEQNNDEREKLIAIKSKSNAFNITFLICAIITLLSIIGLVLTKNIILWGFFDSMSIVLIIMIITEICCYFYYDKRN